MNTSLWTSILNFNFDEPLSEYGFTTRLAKENYWTRNFTGKAILEYKKFMYLAATSDFMVSPSEIVDVVWHQHLIFTQSYSDFCSILGKTIQHVPSTHNKSDFAKFQQAKERTTKLYLQEFGEQPKEIWEYSDMYASLELPKADFKLRAAIIISILLTIVLIAPFYLLLRPLYVTIGNPDFMYGFLGIAVTSFIVLKLYNGIQLKKIVYSFRDFSFVYNLHPYEMIYLKTGKMEHVIHSSLNAFLKEDAVLIKNDNTLKLNTDKPPETVEEFSLMETFRQLGTPYYPVLLRNLLLKPVYSNVKNSMEAFKKYILKSVPFGKVFYINLAVLLLVFELGIIRLLTGMEREKPVTLIFMVLLMFIVVMVIFLRRLTNKITMKILPSFYEAKVLPFKKELKSPEWSYFIAGHTMLAASFVPLVNHVERRGVDSSGSSDSGSSSSSCGSSCGSSCSSCGGCGGD